MDRCGMERMWEVDEVEDNRMASYVKYIHFLYFVPILDPLLKHFISQKPQFQLKYWLSDQHLHATSHFAIPVVFLLF